MGERLTPDRMLQDAVRANDFQNAIEERRVDEIATQADSLSPEEQRKLIEMCKEEYGKADSVSVIFNLMDHLQKFDYNVRFDFAKYLAQASDFAKHFPEYLPMWGFEEAQESELRALAAENTY